ncbi:MAG: hypothetical protein AAGG51_23780 [Cyanobacteria bacterium P01_G01_bin.54]
MSAYPELTFFTRYFSTIALPETTLLRLHPSKQRLPWWLRWI